VLIAALVALLILAAMGFVAAGGRLPSIGPPPTRIIFTIARDGRQQVYVMGVDGSRQTRLSDGTANDQAGAWSPDGKTLAFASDRNGKNGIWVMNADGSHLQPLWADPRPIGGLRWSPDGKRIALHVDSSGTGCNEVWMMAADGSNPHALTQEGPCNWAPDWSPDGTKLSFGSTRDGNFVIYLMDPDGTSQTHLTRDTALNDAFPAFSPDGTKIAFTRWDSNVDATSAEVVVMNADGSGSGFTPLTYNAVDSPDQRSGRRCRSGLALSAHRRNAEAAPEGAASKLSR
jgi:TolB protein